MYDAIINLKNSDCRSLGVVLVQQIDRTVIIVIIGVVAAVLAVGITMVFLQIDKTIIIALISVIGGVLPVGISYVLTKNKEIDANIRQEKTKRYDDLIDALMLVVRGGFETFANDPELFNNFNMSYHRASAYASDPVLRKCNDLLIEITKGVKSGKLTPGAADKIIDTINEIYTAIRQDINPRARYFRVYTLWTE